MSIYFWFQFALLIACLFISAPRGGMFLGLFSGIGLIVIMFGPKPWLGLPPGKPPVDVILTIIAVVAAGSTLQASGGLDCMLQIAEKILRKRPKVVTFLAPLCTFTLTILCGTGHTVYTLLPIIYDVAIKTGIRPERPMAVSSVASQMGVSASPVSVAVVSIVGFMAAAGQNYSLLQILSISVPATLFGVLCAAFYSYRRGRDLEKDEAFQEMIKDPEQKEYIYGDNETLQGRELPSSYYHATGIFLIGIICIAILGNFPDLLPHFPNAKGKMAAISMTTVIQMVMLFVSALILFACKTKAKEVGNSQVFRAGIVALVSVYGVAWMADTYFASHMGVLKTFLGSVVTQHPWTYGLVLFFTSKLVNSQGAAVAIVMPMALGLGMDPVMVMSFLPACYGYFFLPTYPSDLACIGFDRSGTTRIGKFVLNHSFMLPGLIGVICACGMSFVIAHAIL